MRTNGRLRTAVAIGALAVTTACAGTNPAAPSDASTARLSSAAAATDAKAGLQTGTGIVLPEFFAGGIVGFNAVPGGREVTLQGDISGTNFEPGVCNPGDFGPTRCLAFGDLPGQFTRLAPGGVAFTTCHCTVAGVGGPGDTVTLKISYPPATPPQYAAGFTKFTFQDGTGALATLSGQGTLDFSTTPPSVSFTYRFAGRP